MSVIGRRAQGMSPGSAGHQTGRIWNHRISVRSGLRRTGETSEGYPVLILDSGFSTLDSFRVGTCLPRRRNAVGIEGAGGTTGEIENGEPLGRLSVVRTRQSSGLGKVLLVEALRRIARVADLAGGIGLFVDAKDEGAAQFYAHFGFEPTPSGPLTLFMPAETIARFVA
jgi:GNAT superfamily N-acetyltransferase